MFEPENNFKLVCGSAQLKVTEPPRDELFGLTFRRALKVYRRVEYLEEYVEKEWPENWEDDEEQALQGPIEVVKQRWVEVRKVDKKIKVNLGQPGDEGLEGIEDVFDVSKKDGTTMSYRAPFRSEWFGANSACLNDDLHLNLEQLGRLGSFELIEFTDSSAKQLAYAIDFKPPFRYFERLDRSDKYIVCRVSVNDECFTDETTGFYKFAKDRNAYNAGDLRISFH